MSGASERANGRASGLVLQFVFLAVIYHSALPKPYLTHVSHHIGLNVENANVAAHFADGGQEMRSGDGEGADTSAFRMRRRGTVGQNQVVLRHQ